MLIQYIKFLTVYFCISILYLNACYECMYMKKGIYQMFSWFDKFPYFFYLSKVLKYWANSGSLLWLNDGLNVITFQPIISYLNKRVLAPHSHSQNLLLSEGFFHAASNLSLRFDDIEGGWPNPIFYAPHPYLLKKH